MRPLLLTISVCLCTFLAAQPTVQNVVFASSGSSFQNSQYIIDFTIGESFTRDPSNGTYLITQGFQQPEKKKWIPQPSGPVNTADLTDLNPLEWSVYPNPFSEEISIRTTHFEEVKLYDVSGRLVLETTLNGYLNVLETKGISAGQYTIELINEDDKIHIQLLKLKQ